MISVINFSRLVIVFILLIQTEICFAANWLVGATRTYTKPSMVSALVADGDTVSIDAGVYVADVCKWTADNLLIRGANGTAVLDANNTAYGRKGIFVIDGNNSTIENIEFKNCHDIVGLDKNWAGIRFEGSGIIIRRCYFHDNDNGILDNGISRASIVIEFSEFNHNGYGDGYSHNLYIGHSDTLIFRYNYSHRAHIGHELKSRAKVNYILYNRITNEADGDASREIDLPNGGLAIIMGNIIEQGVNAENSNMIGYASEGATNPGHQHFYLINNTLVNNKANGSFISVLNDTILLKAYNNIFAGTGSVIIDAGTSVVTDTSHNRTNTIVSFSFADDSAYDYHLTSASVSVLNEGTAAGIASNGFILTPVYEYMHPTDYTARPVSGVTDIGAYEFDFLTGFSKPDTDVNLNYLIKNKTLHLYYESEKNTSVKIMSVEGKIMREEIICEGENIINLAPLPSGVYIAQINSVNQQGIKFLLF